MSDHDQNDKELNNYLHGNSDLSARYKALDNKTPNHLDDAILAAAKRQVKSKPKRVSGPFSSNLTIPFATAATILITVGLVNMILPEEKLTTPTVSAIKPEPEKMAKLRDAMKDHKEKLIAKIDLEQRSQSLNSKREEFKSKRIVTNQVISEEIHTPLASPPLAATSTAASAFSSEKEKNRLATGKNYQPEEPGILENKSNIASTKANPASPPIGGFQSDEAIEQNTFSDSISQTEAMSSKPKLLRRAIIDDQDTLTLDELIYNEKKWAEISAKEWLKRIDRLRKLKRDKEADSILEIFKKKFPDFSPDR